MKHPLKLEHNQHPSDLSHWFFFFKDNRFLKCNFCWPAKSLVGTTCKNDQKDKQPFAIWISHATYESTETDFCGARNLTFTQKAFLSE